MGHELDRGSKVFYKGWFDGGPESHWLLGPAGVPRARVAVERGQLDLLDFPSVVQRAGGSTEGLFRLQYEEALQAVQGGWPSLALTQETTHRPMADEVEAAAFADQEHGYDVLAGIWPVNTLCQLAIDEENDDALRESTAVHHGELVGDHWSAHARQGGWHLSGELDVSVERELAGGLLGALRAAADAPAPGDLHVDLREVTFVDFACARRLVRAGAGRPGTRIVLHHCPALVRELLDLLGRPESLVYADEPAR